MIRPDTRTPQVWNDRTGRTHPEHRATPPSIHGGPPGTRVPDSPLDGLPPVTPHISPDPAGQESMRLYTFLVDAPGATAVLLFVPALLDHRDPGACEFTHGGDGWWSLTLRMPADWRSTYTVAVWDQPGPPPWRTGATRREVRLAARDLGRPDPRCPMRVRDSSVVVGPLAPPDPVELPGTDQRGEVAELTLGGTRCWSYRPAHGTCTPLLVLFDGQVWAQEMRLPEALDRAVAAGMLPPVHVLMPDSGPTVERWDNLGVPGGQVDELIDVLLPWARTHLDVDPRGESTVVAGQSLGGLSALWALALAGGEVGHALAQSPSLWRFDVAEALLDAPGWRTATLRTGEHEISMLADARRLAARLAGDRRPVDVGSYTGGHDWACWRVGLISELSRLFYGVGEPPVTPRVSPMV